MFPAIQNLKLSTRPFGLSFLFALVLSLLVLGQSRAQAQNGTFGTYGDVTYVNDGPPSDNPSFQISSVAAGLGYGGLYYVPNGSLSFDQLTNVSADYQMTTGAFGGGAPRFSIGDSTNNANNEIYAFWGTPTAGNFVNPNSSSTWANTGNYLDLSSPDLRFQINGFDGINGISNNYYTYAQVKTIVDTEGNGSPIGFVSLDLDGGFTGDQVLLADNFTVNSDVDQAPEPASLGLLGIGSLLVARRRRIA